MHVISKRSKQETALISHASNQKKDLRDFLDEDLTYRYARVRFLPHVIPVIELLEKKLTVNKTEHFLNTKSSLDIGSPNDSLV